jgi:hypothetical protein
MFDLNDYYSGGYFLVQATRTNLGRSELLPDKLVNLSSCNSRKLIVGWGWHLVSRDWYQRHRNGALDFGIPEDRFDDFMRWCQTEYKSEIAHRSMFYSVDAARRFIKRFLPNTDDLFLIGAGLHKELEMNTWHKDPNEEIFGVEKRIKQCLPMESEGIALGYELVGYDNFFSCSWLCNFLDEVALDLFGIRANQYGLIDTLDETRKIYELIEKDENGKPYYDYWLLVSYPLKAGN